MKLSRTAFNKLEVLDLLAEYYKKHNKLPGHMEWRSIRINPTYPVLVETFGGKKKLKTKVRYHISKRIWDLNKIKQGFQKFYREYGRYPTAPEIDLYHHLPSSRQIQRTFKGGLKELRKLLGIEITDHTAGEYRSKAALRYIHESLQSESDIRSFLDERFGEICVHEEKKYGNSKNTVDFFIYARKMNFGVDVFKTSSYQNMSKNLNIKLDKYHRFPHKLFFVVIGDNFEQTKIDQLVKNKQNRPLLKNMVCLNVDTFKKECLKIDPLQIPIVYIKTNEPS